MKNDGTSYFGIWLMALGVALLLISAPWNPTTAGTPTATRQQLESPQGPVVLNEEVRVDGTIIYLGDLFRGVGDKAGIAVAYAPEPGRRAFFDVNWLYRVAQINRLAWKPLSLRQRAVVVRNSIIIGTEEIKDQILAALIEKGVDAGDSIELSNRMLRLYVPGDSSATMSVEDISYNPATRRFVANVIAPVDGPDPISSRITGRVFRMLKIPVLNRRLARGDIIRGRDIKWIGVRSTRAGRNIVTDEAALIGMAVRRGLRRDAPIRTSEIAPPVLVKKGSLVIMTLRTPQMTLTSRGRAEQRGSLGDVISILNTQSRKIVQATVTSAGQVRVVPVSNIALN